MGNQRENAARLMMRPSFRVRVDRKSSKLRRDFLWVTKDHSFAGQSTNRRPLAAVRRAESLTSVMRALHRNDTHIGV